MTTNNTQRDGPEREGRFTLPIFDFIFGILDRLFKDNATGQVLASRVGVLIVIFLMGLIWFKGDGFMQMYRDSSFESYSNIVQKEKDKRFNVAIQEQLQIVHVSSGSDFSAVYVFRPKNLNYFVDLEVYEGRIPEPVDPKNMGGFPVDKTSNEYATHLAGQSFDSEEEFVYMPTTDETKGVSYMYSCPYFNLDNVYSGTVAMYWYDKPRITKKRLDQICGQAARAIGRSR